MDENYRHCEALVRAADKDRFLATLFAPADKRGPLFALYAFNAEIASVRDRAREPMPGEIRLQWWRDVINGERTGEAAANPIAAALIDTVARFSLPKPRLLDLIEAHAFDLYDDPMPTFDALEGYIRHTSATVFDLAGANLRRICRAGERAGRHGVRHHGIVAFLRAPCIAAAAVRSRSKCLIETRRRLRSSQARRHLVWSMRLASLRDRARESLSAFEALLPQLPVAAMPAFLPVALVPRYLSAMERPGYEPFRTAVEVPQWRRQWALWRAAHRWSR